MSSALLTSRVPLGDVTNRKMSVGQGQKAWNTSATSPSPAPFAVLPFAVSPSTCVPSVLHQLGLDRFAPACLLNNVCTVAQLQALSYESLRSLIPCEASIKTVLQFVAQPSSTSMPSAPRGLSAMSAVPIGETTPMSVPRVVSVRRHEPYAWKCLNEETERADSVPPARDMIDEPCSPEPQHPVALAPVNTPSEAVPNSTPCTCLIQFRWRQVEFSSPFTLVPGQYVMVSGDRGQDLGLTVRVNNDDHKSYVERTGPQGNVLRLAFQKEVDYYTGALQMEENAAVELCRQKVLCLGLNMEVHGAEYQYDKKKLTFYYESCSRVDFVLLLKELYREFGCRIWMEKMRVQ